MYLLIYTTLPYTRTQFTYRVNVHVRSGGQYVPPLNDSWYLMFDCRNLTHRSQILCKVQSVGSFTSAIASFLWTLVIAANVLLTVRYNSR